MSVAELLAEPESGRPVRGQLCGRWGTAGASTWTLSDATGEVHIVATATETANWRGLGPGLCEVVLRPIDEPPAFEARDGSHVELVAGRLHTAASASFLILSVVRLVDT